MTIYPLGLAVLILKKGSSDYVTCVLSEGFEFGSTFRSGQILKKRKYRSTIDKVLGIIYKVTTRSIL